MKDPFYRQIVAALEARDFDPETFEACMGDLLRDTFSGLVPISGGSDAGMDGAIADEQGEPYPLVCTTRKDVIGNLTRSLDSYLKEGGRRRRVVLTTSQALSPTRRRNLSARAREKGFTLIQVVEQRGVADRLYHSSRWCRDLLGLSGAPQALSMVPRTRRPLLEIELIGREADVEWLKTTTGDRLISGEPGSGKTFLLRELVRQGWGLFLVSDDRREIANSVREQKPERVIVDDAHRDPDQVERLRHLREEIGAAFEIVATSWEGERERVAEALGSLAASQIRRLELLTRAQILEVIRQAGIHGPENLQRELVDQAANKPGLAVTLALLCLRGDWRAVVEGQALRRSLVTVFEDLIGSDSIDLLAALGLGGDRGMPVEVVGEYLDLGRQKARELAVGLAAGGVLSEAGQGTLAVRPRALRSALLRQVFFQAPRIHDYRQLLKDAPSFDSAAQALVEAAHRGAEASDQELRELVVQSGSSEVWRTYTALGEDEARWALRHYPGDLINIAEEALLRARRTAIPRLLERAAGEDVSAAPSASRPLDLLRGWMQDLAAEEERPGELIARRKLAVQLAKQYLEGGGARHVATRVLLAALTPWLGSTSRDPGMGRTVTVRRGLLPLDQMRELEAIWGEGRGVIDELDADTWNLLAKSSWDWSHPDWVPTSTAEQPAIRDVLQSLARKVFGDIAPLATESAGLAAGLTRLASRVGVQLQLPMDPLFDLLYPADDSAAEEPAAALVELAGRWAAELQPRDVAQELNRYEREAARIGQQWWPRRSPELCRFLAKRVAYPEKWVEAFLDNQLSADLLRPFLETMVEARPEGWQGLLTRCLELEPQAWEAVRLILKLQDPPARILEMTFKKAPIFPQLIETLSLRKEVHFSTLESLLGHPDPQVALAAAVGDWLADPRGEVTGGIDGPWRRAILRSAQVGDEWVITDSSGLGYWLGEILSRDQELAYEWLEILLKRDQEYTPESFDFFPRQTRVILKAVNALQQAHRLAILDKLEPGRFASWLLPHLVGRNVVIYSSLLELDRLKDDHLRPLAGQPDEEWVELAKLALTEGLEPRLIAEACFLGEWAYAGYGHDYWSGWDHAFAELEDHSDEDLREVARFGRERAQKGIQEADAEQRQHELDGF